MRDKRLFEFCYKMAHLKLNPVLNDTIGITSSPVVLIVLASSIAKLTAVQLTPFLTITF